MKMLANGFLGINKATPEARLHINGNMRLRTSDNIVFGENSTGGVGEWITNSRQGTLFNAYGLAFYGNFKERMRIEAATGDVGIGVNDPTHRLHVVDTPNDDPVRIQHLQDRDDPFVVTIDTRGVLHRKRFNLNNAAILNCNTPNNVPRVTATGVLSCSQITDTGVGTVGINASGDFAYSPSLMLNHSWIHGPIGTGNPTNFKLNVGGVARANAIYLYSDEKYKRDVLDMENSLEVISRLKPKTYTWNDEAQEKFSTDDARHIGFIAQELMEVIPEIVVKDNESDLSVNYIELIPILVGAIKEQQKQINELKSRFVKSSNIKPENEIGNIDDASSLSIYPSPSKNSFTATISNATIKSVQIISISGQVIYSADFNQDRSRTY